MIGDYRGTGGPIVALNGGGVKGVLFGHGRTVAGVSCLRQREGCGLERFRDLMGCWTGNWMVCNVGGPFKLLQSVFQSA